MNNRIIAAFALLASSSALAGSHVSLVALPYDHSPISKLRVDQVTYGKVIVDTQINPNCDDDKVCPIYTYATKVRIHVAYDSPAGFNRGEDVGADYGHGMLEVAVDFDPSQFSAEELAKLSNRRSASAFFSVTAKVEPKTVSVIDYNRSEDCLESGMGEGANNQVKPHCTPRTVYKNVRVNATILQVSSND